jgi:hypothetical protein
LPVVAEHFFDPVQLWLARLHAGIPSAKFKEPRSGLSDRPGLSSFSV